MPANLLINKLLIFISILFVGEFFASLIFYQVRKFYGVSESDDKVKALLGGIIERIVLFSGLVSNVSQVVIMFGALKIGTMLAAKKDDKKKVEYFLAGNFISVLISLVYFLVYLELIRH